MLLVILRVPFPLQSALLGLVSYNDPWNTSFLLWLVDLGAQMRDVHRGNPANLVIRFDQWLFLVPVKVGIGGIVHPPIGSIYHLYTTYILPFGGLYATYHLSWEPETTIDLMESFPGPKRKLTTRFFTKHQNVQVFFSRCWVLYSNSFHLHPVKSGEDDSQFDSAC